MGMEIPYQSGFAVGPNNDDEQPEYLDTTNFYQSNGRVVISTQTQNIPPLRFEPTDPTNPNDIQSAAARDKIRQIIEKNNNIRKLMIDAVRLLWTDGPIVFYTHSVTDQQRFGVEKNEETGEDAPKQQEVIEVYGMLEAKLPMTQQCFNMVPAMSISIEIDTVIAKSMYPEVKDKITEATTGAAEDQYERIARMSVMQGTEILTQSGDSLTHLVTWQRVWFRPSAFEEIGDDAIKQQVMEMFPDGARVVFMGETFCEAVNEGMDKHIEVVRPLPGDGNDTPSLGDVAISPQERLNDLFDIQIEGYEKGIPATYYDQKTIDVKAMKEQTSLPAAKYPCNNPAPGQPLANQFFTEQAASIPADMIKHIDDLKGPILQTLCGTPPALFGGSMEDQKTAAGYSMAREQAMGVQGPVWVCLATGYAKVMQQATDLARLYRKGTIRSGTGTNMIEVTADELQGNATCYPEVDSGLPQSPSQQRNTYMMLMQASAQNPELAKIMMDPNNLYLGKKNIDLQGLEIPGSDSRDKQLWEIQQLLKTPPEMPMPGAINPQTMQPMQPTSTITPDMLYDDQAVEFQTVKDWVNSEDGRTAKMTNPEGFMNVWLHGKEHQDMMKQQQMEQMAPIIAAAAQAHANKIQPKPGAAAPPPAAAAAA